MAVDSEWPKVSDDPVRQAHYEKMRQNGESHGFAKMCALQRPPGTKGTEKALMQGATSGKRYISGLARFPGDPQAYVSGADDVLRIARERNLNVEGCVNHQAHEVEPPESVPLADDIVDGLVQDAKAKDPGLEQRVGETEIREMVKDRHTPGWKK